MFSKPDFHLLSITSFSEVDMPGIYSLGFLKERNNITTTKLGTFILVD